MTKWEYCLAEVLAINKEFLVYVGTPDGVNVRIFKKSPGDSKRGNWYMHAVAQLGSEGWELVTRAGSYGQYLTFKRPLQEG